MGKLDLHFFTPDFAEVNVRYYKGIMKSCQRQSLARVNPWHVNTLNKNFTRSDRRSSFPALTDFPNITITNRNPDGIQMF